MLKHTMTYPDFNDNQVTKTFYFNLTKAEIIELEADTPGGFGAQLQRIVESGSVPDMIKEFKNIILLSYGVKSDDGESFVKSEDLRQKFVSTAAYAELYTKLATDDKFAVEFITAVLPSDIQEEIKKANTIRANESSNATLPPPPPQSTEFA